MLSRKKHLRDHAHDVAEKISPRLDEARAKAGPALADARAKAEPALRDAADRARVESRKAATEARVRATPLLEEARKQVQPALEDAERVEPTVSEALKKAQPFVDDARKQVAPVLDDARRKAGPLAAEARKRAEELYDEHVLPGVASALTLADDATSEFREEAGKRSHAAVAALKGEVEPPKQGHPVRTVSSRSASPVSLVWSPRSSVTVRRVRHVDGERHRRAGSGGRVAPKSILGAVMRHESRGSRPRRQVIRPRTAPTRGDVGDLLCLRGADVVHPRLVARLGGVP